VSNHARHAGKGRFRARLIVGAAAAIAAAISLLASGARAHGVACDQWTGATSDRWNVSSNWSAGVPTKATAVCISSTPSRATILLYGKGVAATVSIQRGMGVWIGPKGKLRAVKFLRVGGMLTFGSATAQLRTPLATITRGATMSGVGTVRGSVVNAGTVDALDGGSGIPLSISGSYRQRSSGTLLSRDEAGRFVQVRAGSASLGGRLDLLILDALLPGSKYAIVYAKTLGGRFEHVVPGYVVHYRHGVIRVVVTPQIQLARNRVKQGGSVAVFGASFGYLGIVHFRLDSRNGPLVGSGDVNSVGGFEGFAHIPPTAPPGRHVLLAVKPIGGYVARARFSVTPR
jgi:hypothetical protein